MGDATDGGIEKELAVYRSYMRSPHSSIKYTTYFPVYDRLFARFVGKGITFVEIGVLNGGSLFMWRDYLGADARIIGIDMNPQARKWEEHGFEIFIGDQSSPAFWSETLAKIGEIDVLLDDGGHTYYQQIATVECVVPSIRDGGLLVVEDTHTSYLSSFGGPSRRSFISYCKNIVDGVNFRFNRFSRKRKFEKAIYSVQFFESIVAFAIDRRLCAIKSRSTNNGGATINAEDFRYSEFGSSRLRREILKRWRLLGLGRYFRY